MSASAPQGGSNIPGGSVPGGARITGQALIATGFVLMALLSLVELWIASEEVGVVPLLVGMALATLPVPIYVALVLWIDRYEKEPIWMLAWAFFWGAAVAGLFSGLFNSVNQLIVAQAYGEEVGNVFGTVVSAPVVEESLKGLALLILFLWKKDEFDGVLDGIIYAGMVGLGFAMTENFLYYGRPIAESVASDTVEIGVATSLAIFVVRGVISPFIHPVFTSMTGIGFGVARRSNKTLVKFLAPVVGLLGAIALHALWNGSSIVLSELGFYSVILPTLLLLWPAVGGILLVVFFELRREGRTVRRYLTPELHSGLISQREYDSLSSLLGGPVSSFEALARGGFKEWRAHSRFKRTAAELAFYRDRVARGVASEDAGREAAYVKSLRNLKERS